MTRPPASPPISAGPLISIVTICKNSERFLEEAIQSVLKQSYRNIEYIIVDGGSEDGTLSIIKRYDTHIARWVSEPDQGSHDALNKGVRLCTGVLIGFLNSDDHYLPSSVEWVVREHAKHPDIDVFFGNMVLTSENGKHLRRIRGVSEDLLEEFRINFPTCFVKTYLYRKFLFDPSFIVAGDYECMTRIYLDGARFRHINRTLVHFRAGGGSSRVPVSARETYLIKRNLAEKSGRCIQERFGRRKLAQVYRALARSAYRLDRFPETMEYLRQSFRIYPWIGFSFRKYLSAFLKNAHFTRFR